MGKAIQALAIWLCGIVLVSAQEVPFDWSKAVGSLGRPFGEKITVAGVGDSRSRLSVYEIDGRGLNLDHPLWVDIDGMELEPWKRYVFVGYEAGEFQSDSGSGPLRFRSVFVPVKHPVDPPPAASWLARSDLTKAVGSLGRPYGRKMEIVGSVPAGPVLGWPLEVTAIDGQPPDHRIVIFAQGKNFEVHPGVVYRLVGYETGGFVAAPDWCYGPNDPIPQASFGFRSRFEVTEVVWPKKLP